MITQEDAALELYRRVKVKTDGFYLVGRNGLWRHATDYELDRILNKFNEMKLEEIRQNKLNEIESIFISKSSEDIKYLNHWFQMGERSQTLLSSTLSAGSVPENFAWFDRDNIPVQMTFEQLQGLSASAINRGAALFFQKQQYKEAIRSATTINEIEAIVWE